MNASRRVLCLLLAALAPAALPLPASAQTKPTLIVFPILGRPGKDYFYLSGGGFPRATQKDPRTGKIKPYDLPVIMYCPSVIDSTKGEAVFTVKVDATGSFLTAQFKVPVLASGYTGSCDLRAKAEIDPFGAHTRFTILDPGNTISYRYDPQVLVSQSGAPGRSVESVRVKPYIPGANLQFKEHYAGAKAELYSARLPWSGTATIHRPIPSFVDHSTRVSLTVTARFHQFWGIKTVNFVLRR